MGEALLNVQGISVRFGVLRAVDEVSMTLGAGDLVGLIGPNGAGKTTLLRAIAGLQGTAAGEVRILGEPGGPGGAGLKWIGFTPDTPVFYEDLTVRQFLTFIALGYQIDRHEIDERIDFWLEKVWLSEKAGQKIKGLSRGMRQRVGIARTLLPNPAVVLLDEPAAGLDPAGRVQFRQLLCHLRDQGKALIVSSHILSDMGEYCTHIGMMSAGKLVKYGTVAEVTAESDHLRRRYTIVLAHPVARLGEQFAEIPDVTHIDADGDRATIEYHSDRESAARLLAELMSRKLPVASFAPNEIDLEEAYLRTGIKQVD